MFVFEFICRVDAKQSSCKGSYLTKTDKERLVDFACGIDVHSAKEQHESAQRKDCSSDYLKVKLIHNGLTSERVNGLTGEIWCKGNTKEGRKANFRPP